jgi:D-serine deaminase-like pyridoxal phosphate-dependent protein
VTLASISSAAIRAASALSSHGSSCDESVIAGLTSMADTARGASSAKCSRTMNSSTPVAAESRAEAAQSIRSGSSPGT